jgi:hypothetical protein
MKHNSFIFALFICILMQISCKKDSPKQDPPKKDETIVTPPTDTKSDVILDRPINLTASKGTFGNQISISWTAMPLAKKYQVYKFNDTEQEYKLLKETESTTVDDIVTTPLIKVFYKVKIYNSPTEYSLFSDIDYGYASGKNYMLKQYFGSQGEGTGQFLFPMHVEVDSENNIYVSDENNNKVEKFSKVGAYLEKFTSGKGARGIAFLSNGNAVTTETGGSPVYVKVLDKSKKIISQWGTYGEGDGNTQFGNIEEITVDDEQNIYIVDGINNYVKKFDQAGKFLLKFKAAIQTDKQIDKAYPFGITYFKGKIFVTSPKNSIIRIYDKKGGLLSSLDIGTPSYAIKGKGDNLYLACAGYVLKTDEKGEIKEKIGEGDFLTTTVVGLAINTNDEVIASDVYARRIFVFKQQ